MAFTPFVETDQPTMEKFNEKFEEAIQAALDSDVKIETGSYVGTGTFGTENPNTLIFSFEPKLVIIGHDGGELHNAINPVGNFKTFENGPMGRTANITWSGNTISWFQTETAQYQLNENGTTYYYFAIGKLVEFT